MMKMLITGEVARKGTTSREEQENTLAQQAEVENKRLQTSQHLKTTSRIFMQ